METSLIPLFYLCSIARVVLVAGGTWLIYKQKICLDRESKEVAKIESPIGKFKNNVPALVLMALGSVPRILPILRTEIPLRRRP